MNLTDAQLDRYARHIVLKEIGGDGQRRLLAAKVAVIGAGGIGSPAIQYLAAAGVGTLRVIDDDRVGLDNLQRQVLFGTADVGARKAERRRRRRSRGSIPTCGSTRGAERLTAANVGALLDGADLVLDGCDNFATRLAVSDACTNSAHPARLGRDRPVPGADRHLARLGGGQALLSLLRRRRLRRRGLRHLLGARRARRDGRAGGQLGGAGGGARDRRRSATDPAGKLHVFDGLAPAMRTIRIVKDPACQGLQQRLAGHRVQSWVTRRLRRFWLGARRTGRCRQPGRAGRNGQLNMRPSSDFPCGRPRSCRDERDRRGWRQLAKDQSFLGGEFLD